MRESEEFRRVFFWIFIVVAVLLGMATVGSGELLYQNASWRGAVGTALLAGGTILCALEAYARRAR